ncbi:26S proteasome non-ATPase regulatory subunit 12 [Cladochytrium tenue]|nr:26S proteasome non-ATPase regulatory subunit 12 [Cladochytrium tenue]
MAFDDDADEVFTGGADDLPQASGDGDDAPKKLLKKPSAMAAAAERRKKATPLGSIGSDKVDFSPLVDAQLVEAEKISADIPSNTKILVANVTLCHKANDWKLLAERVTLLSKKHGLLKTSVTKMIQEVVALVEKTPDMATKLELIDTIRTITDGKIFVEVERARVTRILSKIKEDEGKIVEAADILQELQVETYGSMDKREKTDFILEQMRLLLAKQDYSRAQIISRKISTKLFEDEKNHDLKLRFYNLMISFATHSNLYLDTCKYYRHIYDTKSIKEDESKWTKILENVVLYVVLAPYDNEQSDLINRIYEDPNLNKLSLYKEFVKCFITNELVRWPKIDEIYGATLKKSAVFDLSSESGAARWKALHERVIEHNIRVVAKYYTRITMNRLKQLLDLSEKETEDFLSKLVVSKTIHARIDRPAGFVSFVPPSRGPNTVLNAWSSDINKLLELISTTCHLINKEEMVQSISQAL